jgi:hypothetical protein
MLAPGLDYDGGLAATGVHWTILCSICRPFLAGYREACPACDGGALAQLNMEPAIYLRIIYL